VSEIFDEVNEELRREQLRKIWERYSALILGAAVLIVVGVGGWRGYQYWQAEQAAKSGAAFEAAVTLAEANKTAEAQAAFAKIATEGAGGYRMLAQFRSAAETGKSDAAEAVKLYDAIVADGRAAAAEKDLAQLRAAELLIDTASYDDVRKRLEPLTATGRTFRHSAREMLALSAWRANDATAARQWLDMIAGDAQTPASMRSRAEALQALLPPAAKS
jgi:hypothetical protein